MNSSDPLKVEFEVSARFAVEFIDADDDAGRGIKTIRERVAGKVTAVDESEAGEIVRQAIRSRYPVCWSMRIGTVHAVRL